MTYSIIARDPTTGEFGVAVQSHSFGVGSQVSWAKAGAGAVATQSVVDPAYGPRGLALMRDGAAAQDALECLLSGDPIASFRQVALVDGAGRVAVHTGEHCIEAAGHCRGAECCAQANTMARETVPAAMVRAYEADHPTLADRLLAALSAAEDEGGDLRGRQSAALLVVGPRASGQPDKDRPVDLRVEDHPDPVSELHRLALVQRSYARAARGDELAAAGDLDGALAEYARAHAEQPDNPELAFWYGVALANSGRQLEAEEHLRRACRHGQGWAELLRRLPRSGLFPQGENLLRLARLLADH